MEVTGEASGSSVDLPPWAEHLLYVLIDSKHWFGYVQHGLTGSGDDIPTVPELAVDMIQAAIDMLVWRYPEGVVREVVNPVRNLPDELEAAIEEDLDSLIEEVL